MSARVKRPQASRQPAPDIVGFVTDPQLLGLSLSPAQRTLLKSIYGRPLDEEEFSLFTACTGRQSYPGHAFSEVTALAGARAGKDSRIAAPIVLFEAIFGGHERHLARGERGMIPLVAQDQRAAGIAFGYIRDYVTGSPLLASLIDDVKASEIILTNGITIACFPCTVKSLRGWSIPAAVLDELGFFRLEGQVDSDVEVQASIRRGMIAFQTRTKLVKISTPYMKSGVLYDDFKRAFGQDDPDLLVWRASSLLMNPTTITTKRLDQERRLDPVRFAREYEAEFAEDLAALLASAWIDAAVRPGVFERWPPVEGVRYVCAVDLALGGGDASTQCIGHVEGTGEAARFVQDLGRAWVRPRDGRMDMEGMVREIAANAKRYRCRDARDKTKTVVTGDRVGLELYVQAFERAGVTYRHPHFKDPASDRGELVYFDRSRLYLEMVPLFAAGLIDVLDIPEQTRELRALERSKRSGGADRVDASRGGHEDRANSLALAAVAALAGVRTPVSWMTDPSPEAVRARAELNAGMRELAAAMNRRRGSPGLDRALTALRRGRGDDVWGEKNYQRGEFGGNVHPHERRGS